MWPVVTTTSAATLSFTVRVVAGAHQRLCAASMTSMDAKRAPKLVQATSTRCTVHTTRAAAWTLRGFQSRSAELLKLLCLCHGRITLAFKKPEFVGGIKSSLRRSLSKKQLVSYCNYGSSDARQCYILRRPTTRRDDNVSMCQKTPHVCLRHWLFLDHETKLRDWLRTLIALVKAAAFTKAQVFQKRSSLNR